mmetsp:Transcript_41431/g.119305  ORF Transcript_41431/g.119305 Transcript_41431/m.119305 type:complete len:225 (+) Transcript_41431:272-946(+)
MGAHEVGGALHHAGGALLAPGPPRAVGEDIGRPRGLRQRQVLGKELASECGRSCRGCSAGLSGHRHRDRHGQARPERVHRRRGRKRFVARGVQRLLEAELALLSGLAGEHVRREEHEDELAGADRSLRDEGRRVLLLVHGQGRRLCQQDLPLPADEGVAESEEIGGIHQGEGADIGDGGVPAIPCGLGHRRNVCGDVLEDREVGERALLRRLAHHGERARQSFP